MKKMFIGVFVLLAIGLTFGQPAIAAPPTDVDQLILLGPGDVFGECAFPVQLELAGKAKEINLPGDVIIFTSPGLKATLTNLSNSNQVTLGVTGAFHQTKKANGDIVTVVTGRNLLGDPVAGFVLAIGRFSFVQDANFNLIQPLEGEGQLISVCRLIE